MWNVQKYLDENQIAYNLRGDNYFVCCPWHDEKTGSLALHRDGKAIYCFGCGEGGTFLRYVQRVTPEVGIIEYVDSRSKVKRFTIKDPNVELQKKQELHDIFTAQLELYNGDTAVVERYLSGALRNGIGQFPVYLSEYLWALFFPVYQYDAELKKDILVGIQRRHLFTKDFDELKIEYPLKPEVLNNRPKWQISKNFTKSHHLYGYTQDALKSVYEGIVLVEGIRDKVAGQLLYPQYLWLATFGCHLSKIQAKKILAIHKQRPVIIGYDTDKAGLEGSKEVVQSLVGKVLLRRGVLHGAAKDIGELTEITPDTYFEIDSNIAPILSRR